MKLCCSEVVRKVNGWDEIIPAELFCRWKKIQRELEPIDEVGIPMNRVPNEASRDSRYKLHLFADSSKDVAAAVVYLRVCTDEKRHVAMIPAKTSILSQHELKRQSIPRKELIAWDIGTGSPKSCLESTSLPISDYELWTWTDSRIVISWCSSKTLELRMFERNRVESILRNSSGSIPLYVPTD